MLMDDGGCCPPFTGEALARGADVCKMGREKFDCDWPVQFAVVRFEHDAHAAAADDSLNVIAAQAAEHFRMLGCSQELKQVVMVWHASARRIGRNHRGRGEIRLPTRKVLS